MSRPYPPNFPANIQLDQQTFQNWALNIDVPDLWTCTPKSADEVVQVCNWAKDHGYQVRPRGIMHTWSPLTVVQDTSDQAQLILVDTTENLNTMKLIPRSDSQPPKVRVGVGATMEQLLDFLEQQEGGAGPAPGFSFPHTPAPGNLTVGGVLAINAHGSAIPSPADHFPASYGSLSNQILEFTAVVTDPNSATPDQYTLRTFKRGEGDDKAFLTHVGKAFLVDVTLQVIDNYNLRCQSFTDITSDTLFQAPTPSSPLPENSLASFLNSSGRVEAIWFPYTASPWLKVWTCQPQKPDSSRQVDSPYNYPFSDNLPEWVTSLLKAVTKGFSSLTPKLCQAFAWITSMGLDFPPSSRDLWGPSKNTLLYVKDTTLRVTANGYAVQLKKSDVQQAVHDFTSKFTELLQQFQANGQFPVNSPLEIRVTSLDDPQDVAVEPGMTATSPVISSLSQDSVAIQNNWDVALWMDVLTLPDTPGSNQFYQQLEEWIEQRFSGTAGRAMPEWSKGWAYTDQGAWDNQAFLETIRQLFTTGRDSSNNWNFEVETLKRYDRHNLFSNPFLDQLFTTS
jgi:hypothetical protein